MADNFLQQLLLKINGDSSGATKAIDATTLSFGKMVGAMAVGTAAGNLASQLLGKGFGMLEDAIKGVVMALPHLIQEIAEAGDHMWVMSAQTGVSVEALSKFGYVASQTGTSLETITTNIFMMQRRLSEASGDTVQAISKLGLSVDDLRQMAPEDAFVKIVSGLNGVKNAADRSAAGWAIFGRQFRNIAQLTTQNMDEIMEKAVKMGLVTTQAQADMANAFTDAEADMKQAFTGIKSQFAYALMPAITEAIEHVAMSLIKFTQDLDIDTKRWGDLAKRGGKMFVEAFDLMLAAAKPLAEFMTKNILPALEVFVATVQLVAMILKKAWDWIPDWVKGLAENFAGLAVKIGLVKAAIEALNAAKGLTAFANLATSATGGVSALGLLAGAMKGLDFSTFANAKISIELVGEAIKNTILGLGMLGKSLLVVGAAWAGWKLGRIIADLIGADDAMEAWVYRLRGMSVEQAKATVSKHKLDDELAKDSAMAQAAIDATTLANASKVANRKILDMAEAVKILSQNAKELREHPPIVDDITFTDKDLAAINKVEAAKDAAAKASIERNQRGLAVTLHVIDAEFSARVREAERELAVKKDVDAYRIAVDVASIQHASDRAKAISDISRKQVDEEKKSSDDFAQYRIRRDKEGLAATLALIDARADAEIAAKRTLADLDSLTGKDRIAEETRIDREAIFIRQKAANDANEAIIAERRKFRDDIIALEMSRGQTEIELTSKGLNARLRLIDAATAQEVAARWKTIEGDKEAEDAWFAWSAERWKKAQSDKDKLLFEAGEHERQQSRQIAEDIARERIEANTDGLTKELALIEFNLQQRLEALKEEGLDEVAFMRQKFALEDAATAQADAKREAADRLAKEKRIDMATEEAEQRVNLRQTSLRRELELEDIHYAAELQRLQLAQARDYKQWQFFQDQIDHLEEMHVLRRIELERRYSDELRQMFGDALESIASAFQQLSQIAGDSFAGIAKAIGSIIAIMNTARASTKALVDGFRAWKDASMDVVQDGKLIGKQVDWSQRVAAGWQMAASAMSMYASMAQATDKRTTKGRVLGGASAGASIGTQILPGWGTLIGAGVGAIIGALRHPAWADVAKRIGQDMGVVISDQLAKTIAATAKDKFKDNRQAAEVFHFADILKEAGGLTDQNFDKFAARLRDVFVMVQQGKFTAQQARETLDASFPAFADHVLKSGKIASQAFVELIRLNKQFGIESAQINAFVESQMKRLGSAFEKLLAPLAKPADDIGQRVKDAEADLDRLEKGTKEYADQAKKVADLRAEQDKLAKESMPAIERAARLMTAAFNAAIKDGRSMVDAVDDLGPGLDSLLKTMENLGIDVSKTSVAWIVDFRARVNANRELVDSAAALNEVMLAMSNIGALDADSLADLEAQGTQTYDSLREKGFSQNEALSMMKGFLENVRKAHKDMGLPIDENTQKLIAEAEAAGILGEEQESTTDVLKEGLGEIIKLLGGELPEAWQKAAAAAKTAADDMTAATQKAADDSVKAATEAADAAARAAIDAADATGDGAIMTGKLVVKVGDQLDDQHQIWTEWSRRAVKAADDTTDGVGETDDSLWTIVDSLESQHDKWMLWRDIAVRAAQDVADAVDAVSFGHSPGGIKQIPIEFTHASRAAENFARITTAHMSNAYRSIGGMRMDLGGASQTSTSRAQAASAGDEYHFHANINALDAADVEAAMEKKLYPEFIKLLRRGGRPLTDLQRVL